jgi:hypothetical protein
VLAVGYLDGKETAMKIEDLPREIEIEGKKYPVTSVELDRLGNLRKLTIQGIPISKKKVPVYPFRIKGVTHA